MTMEEKFELWKSLKDSRAYRLSIELGELVWEITQDWDWYAKTTIGVQYVRAADSAGANIAEGWGKFSYKDKNHYFYTARGSLMETMNWTIKAHKRHLIGEKQLIRLRQLFAELPKEINLLMYYNRVKMKPADNKWNTEKFIQKQY